MEKKKKRARVDVKQAKDLNHAYDLLLKDENGDQLNVRVLTIGDCFESCPSDQDDMAEVSGHTM